LVKVVFSPSLPVSIVSCFLSCVILLVVNMVLILGLYGFTAA
jgi:hypothetical protein